MRVLDPKDVRLLQAWPMALAGLILAAVVPACSASGLGGSRSSGDYAAIFEGPANPTHVSPELDPARASSAMIAAAGGTVTATGTDGTRFTLSVPEGALFLGEEITLTPVRLVTDLPLESLGGAVVIGPIGLRFFDFATLTIEPAEEIPTADQVTFGFEAEGADFHLQPLLVDSEPIEILVLNSGGFGVGSSAAAARQALLEREPASSGDRFLHHLGEILLRARGQGSNAGIGTEVQSLVAAYSESLIQRIQAAAAEQGNSSAHGDLKLAAQDLSRSPGFRSAAPSSSCETARELLDLGFYEKLLVEQGFTEGEGLDLPSDALALQVAEACLAEAHEECVADHNLARLPNEYMSLWYLGELGLVSDNAVAQIATIAGGLMEKCYQFDLELISIITLKQEGIGGFESVMTSKVPLRLARVADLANAIAFSELEVAGTAPLVNESITWEGPPGGCTITGIPGGSDVEVLKLPLILGGVGLTEVNLTYHTGDSTEGGTVHCPVGPTSDMPTGGYWSNSYFALHIEELSMTEGAGGIAGASPLSGTLPIPYVARDWQILGGEEVARKEYVRSQDALSEDTTFVLIHTPQP